MLHQTDEAATPVAAARDAPVAGDERSAALLSKRAFLQGLGTAGLLAMSGGDYGFAAADPRETFDVIVIGAGTAGMPLAIFAAARGAKVLVVEKSSQIGGTLYYSGGMMSAAGTRLQARKGIEDTPDKFFEDILRLSHGKCDREVTRLYVDNAGSTVDWLEDIGLKFRPEQPVTGTAHADFLTPRYQSGMEGGRSLIKVMLPPFLAAEAAGNLKVLIRTGAVELVQRNAHAPVTGVVTEDEHGHRVRYQARNVVLTSGGCLFNPVAFERYHHQTLYGRRVYPFSMGEGLAMGVAAGGVVRGGEFYIAHRGVVFTDRAWPAPVYTTLVVDPRHRLPWEIEVNQLGLRYVREDSDVDVLERAQTLQPAMAAWTVFDQAILEQAPSIMPNKSREEIASAFEMHPLFARANSLAELAARMALPPAALQRTVTDYNAAVANRKDPLFGREHMPLPIVQPPFYAIECRGSSIFGHAGLAVDAGLRVIRSDGSPVPNLYAAGEVTGGWTTAGDVVVNGCMVTPAITFGRLLGKSMLKFTA
jgi:fumarate reductase flavoprotein subunit